MHKSVSGIIKGIGNRSDYRSIRRFSNVKGWFTFGMMIISGIVMLLKLRP